MYGWINDPLGNDQFLLFQDNKGLLYRNSSNGDKPPLVYSRDVCIIKEAYNVNIFINFISCRIGLNDFLDGLLKERI